MPPKLPYPSICIFVWGHSLVPGDYSAGKWEWQRLTSTEQLSTVTNQSRSINTRQFLSVVLLLRLEFFRGSQCSPVGLSTGCLFCCWWPSWSHIPTLLSMSTRITSQISYLHLNPHLRFCFRQNSTWDPGHRAGFISMKWTWGQIKASAQVNFQPVQRKLMSHAPSCWKGEVLHEVQEGFAFQYWDLPRGLLCFSVTIFSCSPCDWWYKLE